MKQFDFSKIKEFREAAGLTQDALATLMTTEEERVFTQQVSGWETKTDGALTTKSLIKLCEALKKTPDDFFIEN